MNTIKTFKLLSLGLLTGLFLTACNETGGGGDKPITDEGNKSKRAGDPSVVIWELDDPDRLNPITSTSASSRYIQNAIFSRLLEYSHKSIELEAQLAVGLPEIKEIEEGEYKGGMSLTYEIRPEAVWDDGKPLTAYDYVFTIKAIKNPMVNSGHVRPYYEFVSDIEVDAANNRKFTIYSKDRYFIAEEQSGDLHILPEHIYDAEGLMKKFSIKELNNSPASALAGNADLKRFAEQFNNPKFDRDIVVGSGPYSFKEWNTGQHIIIERKKEWWGNKVQGAEMLEAHPNKITYKIITDQNTAITLVREEEIDVLRAIPPQKYVELKEDSEFEKRYELSTPEQFAYYYIGINTKSPKFTDKKVRRALAHLINRDEIIETLFRGMAIKTNSPINPSKPYYNNNLPEAKYDLEMAKKLLAEAGWKDTDGNGVLDKVIGGKKEDLRIVYKYNQGNDIRKNIGVLLKEEAQKVGIQVDLEVREWSLFLEETKRRDFDLMCSAWSHGPGLDDMKQIWHTSSDTRDGSNRVGFGNAESDKIIDQIRLTLDNDKRKELYLRLQELIYEEQPYIFLCVPSERIVIHNRFDNIETSALRPGYREVMFKLKSGASDSPN